MSELSSETGNAERAAPAANSFLALLQRALFLCLVVFGLSVPTLMVTGQAGYAASIPADCPPECPGCNGSLSGNVSGVGSGLEKSPFEGQDGLLDAIIDDVAAEWDALEAEIENAVPYVLDGVYDCIRQLLSAIASISFPTISPQKILHALLNKLIAFICNKVYDLVRQSGIYEFKKQIEDLWWEPIGELPGFVQEGIGSATVDFGAGFDPGKPSEYIGPIDILPNSTEIKNRFNSNDNDGAGEVGTTGSGGSNRSRGYLKNLITP